MSVLICGSLAYDTIMVFHGKFGEHILPDQIHILNVSFVVPDMRREFLITPARYSRLFWTYLRPTIRDKKQSSRTLRLAACY